MQAQFSSYVHCVYVCLMKMNLLGRWTQFETEPRKPHAEKNSTQPTMDCMGQNQFS